MLRDVLVEVEDFATVASTPGEKTRTKITSGVDSVASLHAKCHTNASDEEEENERAESINVGGIPNSVTESENDEEEDEGSKDLVKESVRPVYVVELHGIGQVQAKQFTWERRTEYVEKIPAVLSVRTPTPPSKMLIA